MIPGCLRRSSLDVKRLHTSRLADKDKGTDILNIIYVIIVLARSIMLLVDQGRLLAYGLMPSGYILDDKYFHNLIMAAPLAVHAG